MPNSSLPAIRFDRVSRHFGDVKAVDEVDLEIRGWRIFFHAGSFGFREDNLPAHDRRL